MKNSYMPSQDLSFYYNSRESKLYIKSVLTVNLKDKETLKYKSSTPMYSEASIFHEVETVDRLTQNLCKDTVLILLLDKVNVGSVVTEDEIRKIIKDDMERKGINLYKVHSKVEKPNTTEVGLNTSTISGNEMLEIE